MAITSPDNTPSYGTDHTVTVMLTTPRWWQFIRRYQAWRARRDLIGKTFEFDGHTCTIIEYTGDNLMTVDTWPRGFSVEASDMLTIHREADGETP